VRVEARRRWLALALALSAGLGGRPAAARTRTYALIVAQNHSLDAGVQPLKYADDDGAKNWELFSLLSERASLFAVLDEETARVHGEAAAHAEVPERAAILDRLARYNDLMAADLARGDEPELFFVYAGHGDVDPRGEGYVSLADGRLTRGELYRDVIAPSRARFVHVIVDACKSYFMVNARGGRRWTDDQVAPTEDGSTERVNAFLAQEELDHYPRAGVIVATSGDQETHEWSRYRGGILSHELRSALTGAADVNGDGRVEYSELRAFLAAANARVRLPEARVEVFSRAPALDRHRAVIDLRQAAGLDRPTRFLHFGSQLSGRFHVEDERGVRYADLNKEAGAAFDVVISAKHSYYVRRGDEEEGEVRPGVTRRIEVDGLRWQRRAIAARGAIDQSFQKDLYRVPFGRGFYDGFVATSADLPVDEGTPLVILEAKRPLRHAITASYLMTGAPAGDSGLNHGLDLRYAFSAHRHVELGLAGQIGHGSGPAAGPTNATGGQALTRAALLATVGVTFAPLQRLRLGLDAGLGWQLLAGSVQLGAQRVEGTEARGLRLELGGALAVDLIENLALRVRGGFALDGVYPQAVQSVSTPTGFLNVGVQFRL
jgi:hypothetical protein